MIHRNIHLALATLILAVLACDMPNVTINLEQPSPTPDAAATSAAQLLASDLTGAPLTQTAGAPTATQTATTTTTATYTPSPTPSLTATPTSTSSSTSVGTPSETLVPTLSATPTLLPSTLTAVCDQMTFIADVTIADGTNEAPGTTFTKTWRVKNTGACAWTTSFALVFFGGDALSGPASVPLSGQVNPGDTVDLSVGLKAPATAGAYSGSWKLRNASGVLFGLVTVNINVTTSGGGVFAVNHVSYSVSTWGGNGFVHCPQVTAAISTNGAGTVQYHWTRSDGTSGAVQTLVFASAGTQSVSVQWGLGHVWNGTTAWEGIYIDSPNHQDFGHSSNLSACTSP